MKKLWLLLIIMGFASVLAVPSLAQVNGDSGLFFKSACDGGEGEFAQGFCYGLAEGIKPDGVTRDDAVRVFLKYLNDNPSKLDESAVSLALTAFTEQWPMEDAVCREALKRSVGPGWSWFGLGVPGQYTAEQCHTDQRLWWTKLERPDGSGIANVSFKELGEWRDEMNDCESVDPERDNEYSITERQIAAQQFHRLSSFLDRYNLWKQFETEDAQGKR